MQLGNKNFRAISIFGKVILSYRNFRWHLFSIILIINSLSTWHGYGKMIANIGLMKTIRQKRIFIVDDNPYWVSLQTQMLKELGFENIITYSNGTDCINHLHLNPAIVFLDYQMEDKNGLEVLQRIKDYYPGISVVFCTGQPDLGIAVSAMKLGSFDCMQDYVTKPLNPDDFYTRIKKYID